jgi:hypothetical protein
MQLELEVLTFAILRELIDRTEVYEAEGTGKKRTLPISVVALLSSIFRNSPHKGKCPAKRGIHGIKK